MTLLHPDSFGAGPQPVTPQARPGGLPPLGTKAPQVMPGGTPGPRPVASGPAAPPSNGGSMGGLPPEEAPPKIRAFDQKLAGGSKHEDHWSRSPNVTGTGAIHCKSFHCKLTGDSLENLDRQINEWLDAHPQYEVKRVTSTVGEWMGKLKEPNLIVQLWV